MGAPEHGHCRGFLTPVQSKKQRNTSARAGGVIYAGARSRQAVGVGWTPLGTNLD